MKLFNTNAAVLACIAAKPDITFREMSDKTGTTERNCQAIVQDLADQKYLTVKREGRKNVYEVDKDKTVTLPGGRAITVGELVVFVRGVGVKKKEKV